MGKLVVVFDSGEPLVIPIDATWRSSREPGERWKWADYDDSPWTPSSVIAKHGDQPWGELKPNLVQMLPAAYLRKPFTVDKPLRRAVLFASALGVYELHLNGQPLNTDVLSPGWTDYRKRVHYFGYDVTSRLQSGDNVLGAILGDGWYAGYLAFSGRRHYYGDKTRFIAHLQLDFEDGSRQIIGTDGSWKAAYGPVREGDLLMGCVYDARLEMPGWNAAGFDDSALAARDGRRGRARRTWKRIPALPIRRIQELPAQQVTEPQAGRLRVRPGPEHGRLGAAAGQGPCGPEGRGAARGNAESRRHDLHDQPARGQGHRHVLPGRRAETRLRAVLHVSRIPVRRGDGLGLPAGRWQM